MVLKFCPICHYYLYLNAGFTDDNSEEAVKKNKLTYCCVNCGHKEIETEGGIISETMVQQKSSEAFKIMINEFTRQDNTLPHIKMIPCPKPTCASNNGKERDVIYMTYDSGGKKNLYICNVCGDQWKSRN
jgi:DNA-directed RNA polymerase subunit M/transcription elongation factor TFIIS